MDNLSYKMILEGYDQHPTLRTDTGMKTHAATYIPRAPSREFSYSHFKIFWREQIGTQPSD